MFYEICSLCSGMMNGVYCTKCNAVRHCSKHKIPNVEISLPEQTVSIDDKIVYTSTERLRVCPECEGGQEYVKRFPLEQS